MKALIIDNGTKHLSDLKEWMRDFECTIQTVGAEIETRTYDLVVLSGSSVHSVLHNESLYKKEIEFVRAAPIPIVGICLGFELIGYTFGCKLEKMEQKEKGFIQIETINSIPFTINGKQEYESHSWCVKTLSENLVSWAKSKDGIEIIKHTTLPVIGFQFHPEILKQPSALEVFSVLKS